MTNHCKSCNTEWNYVTNACPSCGSTEYYKEQNKPLDPTLKAWYDKIKKYIIPKEPVYPWEAE